MTVDALQIQKLDMRDGDVVVITTDQILSNEARERLADQWAEAMPNNKIIVLPPGWRCERLRIMTILVAGDLGLDDQTARRLEGIGP